MTKEEATNTLKKCGILDKNGQVNKIYEEIIVKVENKDTSDRKITKMTEEQYIKALDCCVRLISDCQNCPYCNEAIEEDFDCEKDLRQNITNIIKYYYIENERLYKEVNQLKEVIKAKEALINTLNKCYAKSVADACDRMVELLSEKAEVDEHNDW